MPARRSNNAKSTYFAVTQSERQKLIRQKAFVVWFTGLSGSGKTTLAGLLEIELYRLKLLTYVLDGDQLRNILHKELSYTREDRLENVRRNGQIAKMFTDAGLIVICAFMSGIEEGRKKVKALFSPGKFVEIYLDCPVNVCQERDPKGLYKKAKAGSISNLLGFDIPYEPSNDPNIVLDTSKLSPRECVQIIVKYLIKKGYLKKT